MHTEEVLGRTMRVFDSAPPSMRSFWEMAELHGDKPYLVFEDEHYTYAQVAASVRSLAHHLRDVHGVGSGDRVAIGMRNYPEWVITHWATLSIGAAAVGLNAWWTTPELLHGLSDSRPKVLVVDGERLERVVPILDELRDTAPLAVIAARTNIELPDGAVAWDDVVDGATAPPQLPAADIAPDDDALIFYTSGTTGTPKGAQITHRGSVHNVLHLVYWTMLTVVAGAKDAAATEAASDADGPTPPADAAPSQPVFMGATPLFHVTACNCLLHPATLAGARVVLMRKWDAGRALELIEREGVTNFSGVPTMGRELISHPDFASRDTSTLASIAGGGAPVPPDLVGKIDEALPSGAPTTGYGLTETSGIITANSSAYYLAKPLSCGPVVPTLDAKLVDELGNDLEPGPDVVGRLCVKGPIVIKGYLNRPDATAAEIVDGWFDTGDVARIDDDGFVFIVDRAKDMVLRGGENVYCSEVEAAIYQHPDVVEAAVFGIPDDRLGEAVAAAIVLRDGTTLDQEGLRAFLDGQLAAHKIPSSTWFRTEALPRNANGKFLKRQLRDELLADTAG
ncbi:MAG: acyl--CoA ligase [Acidimicrobiales bacterium]|nr:acyl--CoA ligase [Acidimicrobiales bacterium]